MLRLLRLRLQVHRTPLRLASLVLMLVSSILPAQQIKEIEFKNQPITDILLALGEIAGKSIVPDESVGGTASYYFSQMDFETALQTFLTTYKLYLTKEANIYYVSRIRTSFDAAAQLISLDAEDVGLALIIRAASRAMDKTILFDALPSESITVHVERLGADKFLEILIKKFTGYKLESDADYFYIKRLATQPDDKTQAASAASAMITRTGDSYAIDFQRARFRDVLDELFAKAKREYSFLVQGDVILEKLRFAGKSFDELLRLILEQARADFTLSGGICYIYQVQDRDVLKKLKSTVRVPLEHLSVKQLNNLLPTELSNTRVMKVDEAGNSVILNGSLEEIGPLQDFLRQIDVPQNNQAYFRFDLNHVEAAKVKGILPPSLQSLEPIAIPGTNSIIAMLTPGLRDELAQYLLLADKKSEAAMVKLKYIKAKDLIEKLPPSVTKEEVRETLDPSTIFVRTSAENLESFIQELRSFDKPVPQLLYQVLVVQYQEGESLDWSDSVTASPSESGAASALLGTLGQLLSLDFDIVATFGYQFALQLDVKLGEKKARVLADTTLVGLSDQDASFQNTETFRYRELEVDEKGEPRPTGVTREISAGLVFKIKGWVSGDEMISMNVSATVSKRGADASSSTGTLPTTSEQVVTTNVRTTSGKPVVIGGLIRQETSVLVTKVPILGDIPLLGLLFQARTESVENTELVIYILPRVDHAGVEDTDIGLGLERLHRKFVAPALHE